MAKIYKVVVDYGLSLSKMIDFGRYGWVNDDITDKRFKLQGSGQQEVELVLVHLNRNATTREVLEYLKNQGLEPAKIEHLLAFGGTFPELQKQFSIIALGSSFAYGRYDYHFSSLSCDGYGRELYLLCSDVDHWDVACRFLAVRKTKAK